MALQRRKTAEAVVSYVAETGSVFVQIRGPGLRRMRELIGEIQEAYKKVRAD